MGLTLLRNEEPSSREAVTCSRTARRRDRIVGVQAQVSLFPLCCSVPHILLLGLGWARWGAAGGVERVGVGRALRSAQELSPSSVSLHPGDGSTGRQLQVWTLSVSLPGANPGFCHLLAGWLWACYLTSLSSVSWD